MNYHSNCSLVSKYKIGVVNTITVPCYNISTIYPFRNAMKLRYVTHSKHKKCNIAHYRAVKTSFAYSLIYNHNVYHLLDCSITCSPCNKMFLSQNYFSKMKQSIKV